MASSIDFNKNNHITFNNSDFFSIEGPFYTRLLETISTIFDSSDDSAEELTKEICAQIPNILPTRPEKIRLSNAICVLTQNGLFVGTDKLFEDENKMVFNGFFIPFKENQPSLKTPTGYISLFLSKTYLCFENDAQIAEICETSLPVYENGTTADFSSWMACPHIKGRAIDTLRAPNRKPSKVLITIFTSLLDALIGAQHSHNDLSLSNILVYNSKPVITGWHKARPLETEPHYRAAQSPSLEYSISRNNMNAQRLLPQHSHYDVQKIGELLHYSMLPKAIFSAYAYTNNSEYGIKLFTNWKEIKCPIASLKEILAYLPGADISANERKRLSMLIDFAEFCKSPEPNFECFGKSLTDLTQYLQKIQTLGRSFAPHVRDDDAYYTYLQKGFSDEKDTYQMDSFYKVQSEIDLSTAAEPFEKKRKRNSFDSEGEASTSSAKKPKI